MNQDLEHAQGATRGEFAEVAQVTEEWTRPLDGGHVRRGWQIRRIGVSVPGAFVAGLLAATLAVGAAIQPAGSSGPDAAGSSQSLSLIGGADASGSEAPGGEPTWFGGRTPEPNPTDSPPSTPIPTEPAVEPTPKPTPTDFVATPKPTVKPTIKPTIAPTVSLSLAIKENHPYASWSTCDDVDFDAYKLVRSTDSTVSWPAGSNDTLVAAVARGGKTAAWDGSAPSGAKLYYRVFCVIATSTGYKAVRSSAVKGIETPGSDATAPAPCSISLTASLVAGAEATTTTTTGGTGVALDWTACASSGLVYYKVVRSAGPNPSYLPWTEGTVVVAVVGPDGATAYVDHPGSGIWQYRVQALGTGPDGTKVVLGQTAVVSIAVP